MWEVHVGLKFSGTWAEKTFLSDNFHSTAYFGPHGGHTGIFLKGCTGFRYRYQVI